MKLYEALLKDFEKHVYLHDVNSNVIASGEPWKLFDVLGYYFLNLDVIRINDVNDDCNITVDFKLGGDE